MIKRIFSSFIIFGLLLSILTGCSKPIEAKSIEEKLALANKYVLDQKYDEAILTFQEIIKIDPKLIKPYVGIAHVYILEGKPDPAEKTLQDAIKVVDDKNSIQIGLGNIYLVEQKYDQAEKSFLAIIGKDPKYQDAYEGLVQVYEAQTKVDKVIDILNQAIKNNPSNPKNYSLIATAYFQKGDKAKALDMIKTSLKMDTVENYDAIDALGNIYGQDWANLIFEGDKLLSANSQDKVGALFKFYGLFNSGEYQKALEIYQTDQDYFRNGRLKVDVALSFYRMGSKDKAKSIINTLNLDNIENESYLIDLINYFKETGDKDKAIQLAKKGLLFDRKLTDFYHLLYQLTGDQKYSAWLKIFEPQNNVEQNTSESPKSYSYTGKYQKVSGGLNVRLCNSQELLNLKDDKYNKKLNLISGIHSDLVFKDIQPREFLNKAYFEQEFFSEEPITDKLMEDYINKLNISYPTNVQYKSLASDLNSTRTADHPIFDFNSGKGNYYAAIIFLDEKSKIVGVNIYPATIEIN